CCQPMSISRLPGMNLRRLILLLSVLSALMMMGNSIYAGYLVQRQQLIDATLQSNEAYAAKLALSDEAFFDSSDQQLAYSAAIARRTLTSQSNILAEVKRQHLLTARFNSVIVLGVAGRLHARWPKMPALAGQQLNPPHAKALHESRNPTNSKPFMSATGNL